MSDVKKILIRFPNWLGDIVMSLPIIEALKLKFPQAEIHALVKIPFDEILKSDPRIDTVISFNKPSSFFQKLKSMALAKRLKPQNYDLCICLTRSISSVLPLYLGGIKQTIGASGFLGSFFLTNPIKLDKTLHQRQQYLSFLKPLGIKHPCEFTTLNKPSYQADFFKNLGLNKPYILLHPGASYGSAKTWPLAYFEKLASYLLEMDKYTIVFLGDKSQKSPKLAHPHLLDLTGKTSLNDLLILMAYADLVICNDSGPMHLADGLNVKLLAIFGPTNPTLTGPKNHHSEFIFNKTPCGPCFKRICPLDHQCMRQITPEIIWKKACQLLESTYGSS